MAKQSGGDVTPELEHDRAEVNEGLIPLLISLGKYKIILFGVPLAAALIAAVVSFFVPPAYTASTTFLPPQQQQSITTAALQQLGGLASIAGAAAGVKRPEDLHVAILRSASIQDAIIARFGLMARYDVQYREQARKMLAGDVDITADKSGLLKVDVTSGDAELAARIANAYVEELRKRLSSLAVTEAQQRRAFFEQQLLASKESLIKAELGLKLTQERTGLIALDKQGEAMVKASAELRAQIVTREVELQAMRNFATSQNASIKRIETEIAGLKLELAKLESSQTRGKGDLIVPSGKVPQAGLDLVRAVREVKYQEAIFELLARQFEMAKLDEAREGPMVQQVDVAQPPEFRSRPKRRQIVLLTAMATALVTIIFILVFTRFRILSADPLTQGQLRLLMSSWRIRLKARAT
jgi:tyrosine-protein kinase Etk/Wzc